MKPTKEMIRALRDENKNYSNDFIEIINKPASYDANAHKFPGVEWVTAFRNRYFLVQIFKEMGCVRITVNRTDVDREGKWKDGIAWDELQEIKNKIGYADKVAVEIYPPKEKTVNVSNMRHLWILDETIKLPIW